MTLELWLDSDGEYRFFAVDSEVPRNEDGWTFVGQTELSLTKESEPE